MRSFVVFVVASLFAAAPATAQEKTITVFAAASMKNALDDVNAAFLKAERPQGRDQLCGEFGARAPDRAGRAGRYLRLGRSRVDGLRAQKKPSRTTRASTCSATSWC
jgi:hypothetical protein